MKRSTPKLAERSLLDVADRRAWIHPASGGEGRPGDDRRLAAVDDDSSVVGGRYLILTCFSRSFLFAAAIRVGEGKECVIKFVRYEKSSEVEDSNDSSVSYAGGVCYI